MLILGSYMNSVKLLLLTFLLLVSACNAKVHPLVAAQDSDSLTKNERLKSEVLALRAAIEQHEKELVSIQHGQTSHEQYPAIAAANLSGQHDPGGNKFHGVEKARASPSDMYRQERTLTIPHSSAANLFTGGIVGPGDMLEIHFYRNSPGPKFAL